MPSQFLGEPRNIGQMRIGDSYVVDAKELYVDKSAKCWLNPKAQLTPSTVHRLTVHRDMRVSKNGATEIFYRVTVGDNLNGWRWKLREIENQSLIPVEKLTVREN